MEEKTAKAKLEISEDELKQVSGGGGKPTAGLIITVTLLVQTPAMYAKGDNSEYQRKMNILVNEHIMVAELKETIKMKTYVSKFELFLDGRVLFKDTYEAGVYDGAILNVVS